MTSGIRRGYEALTGLLEARPWLWYLPLVWMVLPLWQAWTLTCAVPRADHWNVIAEPYLSVVSGGSLWDFIHSPGTDSRHDAPKLLHYLVIRLASWNLCVESLVCVALGGVAAWLAIALWRRHPAPVLSRWGCAWLMSFCILSPIQWMNWVWGIQICYTLLVAAGLMMIWALDREVSYTARVAGAAVGALVAIFSFLNGWMVWGLGLAAISVLAMTEQGSVKKGQGGAAAWLALGGASAWLYLLGWPESKAVGEAGLMSKIVEAPGEVLLFFSQVLGGAFAEVALLEQRADRHVLQAWSAPILSGIGVFLTVWALVSCWRSRTPLRVMLPWGLMLLFGLGNALAITVARVGKAGFLVFQSRYPSYTLWFWVGLLGLLFLTQSRAVVWARRFCLVLMTWGAVIGAVQGWRDGLRDARQCDLLEAAVAMRHAAVEPVLLDGVRPSGGEDTVSILDRLDALGLLHVGRVPSALVLESKVGAKGVYLGALTDGKNSGGGVEMRGWALNADTRKNAKAVAISYQITGEPERWLGLATKLTRERNKALKNKSRVFEQRIGWGYEPLTGNETTFMAGAPLRMKRAPMPTGAMIFRAYAFDPIRAEFFPLEGQVPLTIP